MPSKQEEKEIESSKEELEIKEPGEPDTTGTTEPAEKAK